MLYVILNIKALRLFLSPSWKPIYGPAKQKIKHIIPKKQPPPTWFRRLHHLILGNYITNLAIQWWFSFFKNTIISTEVVLCSTESL